MAGDNRRPADQKDRNGINPVAMVLGGMIIALGVFAALFTISFRLADLSWCLPALAVAAVLVFVGSRRLRRK